MHVLGDNLRNLRMKRGLTQQTVADFLKVKRVTYTQYELNKREPDNDTLKKLATFFEVTPNDLLGSMPDKGTKQKKPKDLLKLLEQEDYTLNGRIATQEDKDRLAAIIEAMYWDAKERNKRKKP